ncbi:MAG: sulfotransferase [Myxococcota bacterium]
MNPFFRAYTAARVHLLRPVIRVRGALLRRLSPAPAPRLDTNLDEMPILVLGCHRSGTSLLRRCLNSHSRIACPAETLFLESLSAMLEYPDADKGLAAIDLSRQAAAADLRKLVDKWMRGHAERQGKPRWADKSPGVLAHLDGLERLMGEEARYVAIVRDGMDVAYSLGSARPRWWQLAPFVEADDDLFLAAARYWADRNRKLRAFVDAHPTRVHVLRYEVLIRHPEETLRAVFRFLGEAWEPDILDFNRHGHVHGLEDHHVSTTTTFEDNTGKHRRLAQPQQVKMWDIVAPTMKAFGYDDRTYATV